MWPYLLTILTILLSSAWVGNDSRAESYESAAAIRAAVQTAAERQILATKDETLQIVVGDIDARIRVAACSDLSVDIPTAQTPYMSARVTCRAPFWRLYVPIQLHAWGRAVVAANNLAPGTRLTATDLSIARLDILMTNGAYLTDPRQAEGMILRANVRAGAPILAPLLDRPVIVHRGDTVMLTLFDRAITIRTTVIAAEDGRSGDHILVENPESKKTVRATVADTGTVEIHFDQGKD